VHRFPVRSLGKRWINIDRDMRRTIGRALVTAMIIVVSMLQRRTHIGKVLKALDLTRGQRKAFWRWRVIQILLLGVLAFKIAHIQLAPFLLETTQQQYTCIHIHRVCTHIHIHTHNNNNNNNNNSGRQEQNNKQGEKRRGDEGENETCQQKKKKERTLHMGKQSR
jgi:hypothetical protein